MHAQIAHDLLDSVFAEIAVAAVKLERMIGDLETDIGERNNLADKHPEIVAKLKARMEAAEKN